LNSITIIKANGETDTFQVEKLRQSLRRSGANDEAVDAIVDEVVSSLHDGMTTNTIYRKAYKLLKQMSRSTITAPRYSLKRAIMDMGPSGYPFEHLIARILERHGFETEVGVIRKGHCVNHEVDVLAQRDGTRIAIECKYHNRQGYICDVKVPLYIQSRFLDLQRASRENGNGPEITEGWIVTNTRFSGDAIDYGACMGLRLISWDYPEGEALKDRIERAGLYPVTVLTNLKKAEMTKILDAKIVTCRELIAGQQILHTLGIGNKRINAVLDEAKALCGSGVTN
jgi:hypothetical protein